MKKEEVKIDESKADGNTSENKPGLSFWEKYQKLSNPLWLSVSEAAKLGGVNNKTIRRAIQSKRIKYKVINNRYYIELYSMVQYLNAKTKLKNKFNQYGLGQYLKKQ